MKLRKGDFVVILTVLILAVSIWIYPLVGERDTNLVVSISQSGEVIKTAPLIGTDEDIPLLGCTVRISDGKVAMLESDCDDEVCIRTGEIDRAGDAIICVPNKVSVEISGKDGIDAIAG